MTRAEFRRARRAASNNPQDANKNICALAVARALRVEHATRYLHTWQDLQRAIRTRYSARSVRSSVKGATVGAVRRNLAHVNAVAVLVRVSGHVLLMMADGRTVVDTDARKRDCRKIEAIYGIYRK
jgi:hypothetical protein